MRFAGKVLFATGGASGIAAATARQFAAEGGRVAVVDRDGARAEQLAAELPGSIGIGVDVADESSVQAAIERTGSELGGLDCVLNAAGHAEFRSHRGLVVRAVEPDDDRPRRRHLPGVQARAATPACFRVRLDRQHRLAAALSANKHNVPYGAAKGAIVAFSRQLSSDVAPEIRVNGGGSGADQVGDDRSAGDEPRGG
jgi:3-oxoacyl-[acyl-carrier protein] reductase